jgi:predicted permease
MLFHPSIWQLAWRGLWRHGRANFVLVITLAVLAAVVLGVGSVGHNLLLSPWTYDTDRLGVLRHGVAGSAQERYGFAPDEYRAIAASGVFEAISASQGQAVAFGDGLTAARSRTRVWTQPEALAVSDGEPLLGRFVRDEDRGLARVVISHEIWSEAFASNPEVVGRTVQLDGQAHEIIGVMPPRFHFLGGDFWSAHAADPALDATTDPRLVLNFKLREGGSIAAATTALQQVVATLPRREDTARYPRGWRIEPIRVIDAVTGPQKPAVLLVLAGALALLLLGVLNVAALLVARQIADAPRVATRLALGETRARSIAVAFAESLLLAALGMLLALGLGRLLFDRFAAMIATEWVPRELEGHFAYATPALWSLPLAAFAIAVLLTALRLPGLLRIDAGDTLGLAQRSGGRRRDANAGRWLSGIQIAMATAILVSSLAIGAGARDLAMRDLGFEPTAAQHALLVFPRQHYVDGADRLALLDRFADRLRAEGAVAVGVTDSAPLQRYTRSGAISAWSGPRLDEALGVDYHAAHGDLAGALGLRLRAGRFVDARDEAGSEPVVVISHGLAQRLAPGGDALGARIDVAAGSDAAVARRVVGIVDDVRHESPLAPPRATVYVPYAQDSLATVAGGQVALVVRWPAGLVPDATRFNAALAALDPWIAVRDLVTFEDRALRSVAGVTLAERLFAGFSVLGLVLASLGIAAVAALGVARRRHELAVRSAIGATPRRLLHGVLAGSAGLALPASLAGAGLAWLLVRSMQAALQDSAMLRVEHLVAGPLLLLLCAMLATWLPARRAARVEVQALLR